MSCGQKESGTRENPSSTVQLTINGVPHTIGEEVSPCTPLIDYLRDVVHLTGTKVMCREGGCGACTVVASAPDPLNPATTVTFSVQACQQYIYSCDGWSIETVEHLGNRFTGYHPLQQALAGFYGTQCGYCSPGMVMTMYGQLQSSGSLTSSQVEQSLDGNLCRCTGYRPILDGFKSLATDGNQQLKQRLVDIEDLYKSCCSKKSEGCQGPNCNKAKVIEAKREIKACADGVQWYQPTTLQGVYDIINSMGAEEAYYIVVGNTGKGLLATDGPFSTYINPVAVAELNVVNEGALALTFGANISLTRAMELLDHTANTYSGYQHFSHIVQHWKVVANVSVRNVGSVGGNLMVKHHNPGFQSDIFLTLLGAQAQVNVGTAADASVTQMNLTDFLQYDMSNKVILSLTLPSISASTQYRSYKVTARAVNNLAYINGVFRFEVDPANNYLVLSQPSILYGGINPDFINAQKTEQYLTGQSLLSPGIVSKAAGILEQELVPLDRPQDSSPEYRTSVAKCLLYKAILSIVGEAAKPLYWSGSSMIERPLTSSQQTIDNSSNPDNWPLGKPIPKMEGISQVAGEIAYVNDAALLPNELHAAFIQSTTGRATILSIDPTEALAMAGVVSVITAADIPGVNNFMAEGGQHIEEVLASSEVVYAGQGLGLVVATSRSIAQEAASKVRVEYQDVQPPVLTIQQAIAAGSIINEDEQVLGNTEDGFLASDHIITGQFNIGWQFHFPMECMAARVVPTDDGYDVSATSIWPTEVQSTIAQVLGIDANSINVQMRVVGGSFGGKISRGHMVSTAAALAAWKTHQPVRIALSLHTFITLIGGRDVYFTKYKIGVDNNGLLKAVEAEVVADAGCSPNETSATLATGFMSSVYACPNWLLKPKTATTNTPSNTYMRAPGIVEGLASMEAIMDHVASYLGQDPLAVRELNQTTTGSLRPGAAPVDRNVFAENILPLLKQSAEYDLRKTEVDTFNSANRWRKRGIAIMPHCFILAYPDFRYGVMVNVYNHDGTVAIAHGGSEMGQGINTKASQIAAHILGIPLEKVKIKANSTTTNANSSHTGATICSDIVCLGVKTACETLKTRLDDFKATLPDPNIPWELLVQLAKSNDIDICERFWTRHNQYPPGYDVYGGACVEVEVDILTGTSQIRRADIIEDCGQSMNPYVDVGQVEGAFIQGLGLFTTEKVIFDPTTGQKLSSGTLSYKPPMAADIPVDMRVTLLPNSYNTSGVLSAKGVGEPPLTLSFCVVMALRKAIAAARAHAGNTDYFPIDLPLTVEDVHQLCLVDSSQFQIKE